MADRRGALVPALILLYIFLPRDVGPPPIRNVIDDIPAQEQLALDVVQNSAWDSQFGSFGHDLNVTGLEAERGFAWHALTSVKERAREQLQYALGDYGPKALEGETENVERTTPLYNDVTGYLHGKWKRSKLQESISSPQLNLTKYAPMNPLGHPGIPTFFDCNVTGKEGDASIRFLDTLQLDVPGVNSTSKMSIELKIADDDTYDSWEAVLHGVYFEEIGQAVLTTTSDKFKGIFALPHLTLSSRTFDESKALLNESISRTIQRQIDGQTTSRNPWSSHFDPSMDSRFLTPDCDLVVYLQQLAPAGPVEYSPSMLEFLEDELVSPTGAIVPKAPDIRFSMLVFSPDCGYVLESSGPPESFVQDGNHLTGPKMEVQYQHSRQHLLLYTLLLSLQLFLLMRQMREANTPSVRSRVSFYTITMLIFGDWSVTLSFVVVSTIHSGIWFNLVATAFLGFMSVVFFGMRFLALLWDVQAPERERRVREEVEEERVREEAFAATLARIRAERLAATPASVPTTETPPTAPGQPQPASLEQTPPASNNPDPAPPTIRAEAGGLPLPVTAPRPTMIDTGATPIFMPSDQLGLEDLGLNPGQPMSVNARVAARMPRLSSLFTRFYLLLLFTLFLSVNATAWPAPIRRVYFTVLGLLYVSFWLPQIHRNVQRNCRHALNWEFVLGQSVLRLLPFVYLYGYKHNVLFTDIDYYSLAFLVIWVWIQVVLLISQEVIGPRWFLPRGDWAPPAYDYHPVLREDEEGATMPIGFSQATAANTEDSAPSSPIKERSGNTSRRGSLVDKEQAKEKGKRVFDCAICMQDLEVPVVEAGVPKDNSLVGGGGLLARRMYMVTPCRHIFHSACLEGWLKYRLQCPICREGLPPL